MKLGWEVCHVAWHARQRKLVGSKGGQRSWKGIAGQELEGGESYRRTVGCTGGLAKAGGGRNMRGWVQSGVGVARAWLEGLAGWRGMHGWPGPHKDRYRCRARAQDMRCWWGTGGTCTMQLGTRPASVLGRLGGQLQGGQRQLRRGAPVVHAVHLQEERGRVGVG